MCLRFYWHKEVIQEIFLLNFERGPAMREIFIQIIAFYSRLSICLERWLLKIELCILEIKYQKGGGQGHGPKTPLAPKWLADEHISFPFLAPTQTITFLASDLELHQPVLRQNLSSATSSFFWHIWIIMELGKTIFLQESYFVPTINTLVHAHIWKIYQLVFI